MVIDPHSVATWAIAALATTGVIVRPRGWPEVVWAVGGAVLLVATGLLSLPAAGAGVARGGDVYLFLGGMMVLSELARRTGLFDWLAAHAARRARGSGRRLFALVFAVGTLVTAFLSNDATAVVLTPAVAAVARAAEARDPLPFLLICAFVANAASFLLPISNPANLVLYGSHMPPLGDWLQHYALPSLAAIAATYAALRWTQRHALAQPVSAHIDLSPLSTAGKSAAAGIVGTAVVLLAASAAGLSLGLPTAVAGVLTAVLVLRRSDFGPVAVAKDISWGVLPLVAGLFVLVQSLEATGVTAALGHALHRLAGHSAMLAALVSGAALAFGCNVVNNLPAGLVAARMVGVAHVPEHVRSAMLLGVDLGPNLSVTGSLATILWLTVLRREGLSVGAWQFLKLGALAMPAALILALAASFVVG